MSLSAASLLLSAQECPLWPHPNWKLWGKAAWGRWFNLAKMMLYKATQAAWLQCGESVQSLPHSSLAVPTLVSWVRYALSGFVTSPLCMPVVGGKIWNSQVSCQQAEIGKQQLITLQVRLAAMQTPTITTRASGAGRLS